MTWINTIRAHTYFRRHNSGLIQGFFQVKSTFFQVKLLKMQPNNEIFCADN